MKFITTNLLNRFWKNGIIPIKEELKNKLDTSKIVASTKISEAGKVMDGKTASEEFAKLNGELYKVSNMIPITTGTYIPTREGFLFLWYKTASGDATTVYIKDMSTDMIMSQAYVNGTEPVMINTPVIVGHTFKLDYGKAGNHYFYFMPAKVN